MNSPDHMFCIKVVLIGDSSVGKTSILLRYCKNSFTHSHIATIGVDFSSKCVAVKSRKAKVVFWDTAGQERFRTITSSYYRGANGVILVFDISNRESFSDINNWIEDVWKNGSEHVKMMLIGSKSDLIEKRMVSYDEGKSLASKYNLNYFEVSALKNENIEQVLDGFVGDICKDIPETVGHHEDKVELVPNPLSEFKRKCCKSQ